MKPCKSCPWRLTTRSEDIPGTGGISGPRGREMLRPESLRAMACHLGNDAQPIPCAGFVVVVGRDSVGLRLAAARGVLRFEDYTTDAPLHGSLAAVMAAHPDPDEVDDDAC